MLVMLVFFIAFKWIYLSTPLIRLFLLVLILLLMPTLNFLDLWFAFFFSSRRRHTRWPRDWSSDVCSSDLRVQFSNGLVLPCTYFTANPFENWTRRTDQVTGTVEFDLDWRIDFEGLRAEFDRVVADSEFYNGQSASLVVTDATQGYVRARASVSADDAGQLWNLRVLVRESLVAWLQEHTPEALRRHRVQMVPDPTEPGDSASNPGAPRQRRIARSE